jgi:hypothetical protein
MEKTLNFNSVTEELYKQIDITPTQYELAKSPYEAVGRLTEGGVATDVYTQGSVHSLSACFMRHNLAKPSEVTEI